MILQRAAYRARQFWMVMFAQPSAPDLERARAILSAKTWTLFMQLQPFEQAHALQVLARLEAQSPELHPDLRVAALLHDVGKSCCPLNIWERSLVVLAKKLFPRRVRVLGQSECRGWQRPFVSAEQHPAWGAQLVAEAGASALVVALVRRHQEVNSLGTSLEDHLLERLQAVDDNS